MNYLKVDLINGCKTIEELESHFEEDIIFMCRDYSQIEALFMYGNKVSDFVDIYYFDKKFVVMWNEDNFLSGNAA